MKDIHYDGAALTCLIDVCDPSDSYPIEIKLNLYQERFIKTFDKTFHSRAMEKLNIVGKQSSQNLIFLNVGLTC